MSSALLMCIQPSIISWRRFTFIGCDDEENNTISSLDSYDTYTTIIHLWTQLLMCIPSIWLIQRYQGKYILEYSVCFGGILTLLIPQATENGYYSFIILSCVIGAVLSLAPPAMVNIAINWMSKNEKNYLSIMLTCGDILSNAAVLIMTANYATQVRNKSWVLMYFIVGVLAITWSIFCMCQVTQSPSKIKWVTKAEKEILQSSINYLIENCVKRSVPWIQLLKSKALVVLLCCSFLSNVSHFILKITTPPLMAQIFALSPQDTANVMIIPFVFEFVVSLISGLIADWVLINKKTTLTRLRKIAVFISQTIVALCFLYLATVKCHNWFSVLLLNLMILITGVNKIGTGINFIDLAPVYAGSTFALCNSAKIFAQIITVYAIIEYFHNFIFHIAATALFISALLFSAFGTCEKQKWARM